MGVLMETMLSPIIDLNQWADLEADLIGYLHVFEECLIIAFFVVKISNILAIYQQLHQIAYFEVFFFL